MTNALVKLPTPPARIAGIVPTTHEEAASLVESMFSADMVPNSYEVKVGGVVDEKKTMARMMIGVLKGLEIGLPPVTALSTICVVNNRPCLWGDGAVALVQQRGLVERVDATYEGKPGTDEYTSVYRIWRRGQDTPYEGRFSIGQAKRARLLGKMGPWQSYPERMLFNRARAFALRDGFSDCLMGVGIAEEVADIPAQDTGEKLDVSFLDDGPAEPQAITHQLAEADEGTFDAEEVPEAASEPENDPEGNEERAPSLLVKVPLKEDGSGTDWHGWVDAVREAVANAPSPEWLDAFLIANETPLKNLEYTGEAGVKTAANIRAGIEQAKQQMAA